jgi:DNA-binding NarL/FixJ family response regulator
LRPVLVVDDDRPSCRTLCSLFTSQNGFEVCAKAETAAEAIEEAGHYLPGLIILGLPLSEDSLPKFICDLKKVAPEAHIFLLTEQYGMGVEKQALSLGITAVFSKCDDCEALILNARVVCDAQFG